MISQDHGFHSRPRISPERFREVMRKTKSPWKAKAEHLYEMIADHEHDPAIWLAIGLREHRLLTNERAVALKLDTNSWTNARSVRTPGMWSELITTDDLRRAGISDREGPYVRYSSIEDSLRDGMFRVDDQSYVYRKQGALSIGQVLRIWTESDAEGYIAYVLEKLAEWSDGSYGLSWWDDPEVEYIPDRSGEYGYPTGSWPESRHVNLLILHITAGVDSLDWLNGAHGSSAHYLTWPDGRVRAQLLPESVAAWTAGNREYNERSINIEHEKLRLSDAWSEEEYRNLAGLASRIIERNRMIVLDRKHVIGHSEVPDPERPGRFGGAGNHVDPGPAFEWPRFMAYLHEHLNELPGPRDPNAVHFPETDHWLINIMDHPSDADARMVKMLDFWRSRGGIEVCGYPLEGMTQRDDGVYQQLCENVLLECWPTGFGPHAGPHYRFGGVGRELIECRKGKEESE